MSPNPHVRFCKVSHQRLRKVYHQLIPLDEVRWGSEARRNVTVKNLETHHRALKLWPGCLRSDISLPVSSSESLVLRYCIFLTHSHISLGQMQREMGDHRIELLNLVLSMSIHIAFDHCWVKSHLGCTLKWEQRAIPVHIGSFSWSADPESMYINNRKTSWCYFKWHSRFLMLVWSLYWNKYISNFE